MDQVDGFYNDIPDATLLITPSHALKQIQLFEKTVEVIGIVDQVESKENLFKFILRNEEGDRIQVLAWGEEAKRIQGYIKINFVTHLDGAFAKLKHEIHSMGNIRFDLTVMSNTKVNVLKKLNVPIPNDNADVLKTYKIKDVMDAEGIIAVEGQLNSSFSIFHVSGAKIGQSCIVDEDYKLEVRLQDFSDVTFAENEHVRIIGKINNSNNIPHILVKKAADITLLSDRKLSLTELLRGTKLPKRKATNQGERKLKVLKTESS